VGSPDREKGGEIARLRIFKKNIGRPKKREKISRRTRALKSKGMLTQVEERERYYSSGEKGGRSTEESIGSKTKNRFDARRKNPL